MSEEKPINIPKAKQLFRGDINDAVIRVQKATGIHINEKWWHSHVGNDGTTDQILSKFDQEYSKFAKEQLKRSQS